MALSLGKVLIEFGVDTSGFKKGMKEAKDELGGFGKQSGNAGMSFAKLTGSFISAQAIMAGVSAAMRTVREQISQSIDAASRAAETQNLFVVSFGESAGAAEAWAQKVSEATGINDTTLKNFSGTLFNMTTAMGVSKDSAFAMATGFSQLATDASSFFNVPYEEAFNAIKSGLSGETEPLKRFGILVTENQMKSLDWVKAITDTGAKLTEQEKVLARSQLIMQGMGKAQGDMIRTQDSWANQTRILGEVWTDLQETIGSFITENELLGKMMGFFVNLLKDVAAWIKLNKDEIRAWVDTGLIFMARTLTGFVLPGLALLIEVFGAIITGLGKLMSMWVATANFMMKWVPVFRMLPETIRAGIQVGIDQMDALSQGAQGMGKTIFDSAMSVRDAAGNMDQGIQKMIDSSGKATDKTGKLAAVTEAYDSLTQQLEKDIKNAKGEQDGLNTSYKEGADHLKAYQKIQKEAAESMAEIALLSKATSDAMGMFGFNATPLGGIPMGAAGVGDLMGISGAGILATAAEGVGDIEFAIDKAKDRQEEFNDAIQHAQALFEMIPGNIGGIVSSLVGAGASIKNLTAGGKSIFGGLSGAFSAGKGDATGIMGLIGGIGGVAAAAGPLIQMGMQMGGFIIKGLKSLFGRNKGDVMKEVGRDIGASISDGLAEQILKSGKNAQLFLNEIFGEGGLSPDRLAEEVGDLFSFFERGEISEGTLISELKETIPLLIEHFKELGPAGEEQIQRIISAADRFGIELDEINQLMQATFAPATMEEMAEQFGLTNDEVRAMADTLGIDIQTNLEKMAASLGLTADEFNALGAAMEEQFGIPAEQLAEFLEATGLTAAELASTLGVEVGEGAQTMADAQAQANEEIGAGVDAARALANELERAARASAGINIPSSGTGQIPQGAKGLFVPRTPGGQLLIAGEGAEDEVLLPMSRLRDMVSASVMDVESKGGAMGGGAGTHIENMNFPMPQFADRAFEQHFINRLMPEWVRRFEQNTRGNTQSISKVIDQRRRERR